MTTHQCPSLLRPNLGTHDTMSPLSLMFSWFSNKKICEWYAWA